MKKVQPLVSSACSPDAWGSHNPPRCVCRVLCGVQLLHLQQHTDFSLGAKVAGQNRISAAVDWVGWC